MYFNNILKPTTSSVWSTFKREKQKMKKKKTLLEFSEAFLFIYFTLFQFVVAQNKINVIINYLSIFTIRTKKDFKSE